MHDKQLESPATTAEVELEALGQSVDTAVALLHELAALSIELQTLRQLSLQDMRRRARFLGIIG